MARMENQGALEGALVFMQRTYCLWGCLLEKNNPRLFPQTVTVSLSLIHTHPASVPGTRSRTLRPTRSGRSCFPGRSEDGLLAHVAKVSPRPRGPRLCAKGGRPAAEKRLPGPASVGLTPRALPHPASPWSPAS